MKKRYIVINLYSNPFWDQFIKPYFFMLIYSDT